MPDTDHSHHGGMAWDHDNEGRAYPKSVVACEKEDISRAWQKHRAANGQKGEQ
jgi:hypothetical protein